MNTIKSVLAYDGICNLCNALVRFVLKQDKYEKIQFVSLQSESFQNIFPNETVDMKTLYFYSDGNVYKRSDAILQIFKTLGRGWKIALIFYVFPKFVRDAIYRGIANTRYRIFGRTDQCQIPDERYLNRFLD